MKPIHILRSRTADAIPPTLSSATGVASSDTTADLSVATNEAGGILYWIVSTSATPPTVAQIKGGDDSTGSAAAGGGGQAVSATGTQTAAATGLTGGTTYYAYFLQTDTALNNSSVASAASFATAISSATFTTDFSGTSGTKLSTLMDLILGDDCMSLSGAGKLNKATSTASFGIYASVGAGFHHQKVTVTQVAASLQIRIAVLAGDNSGLTGYVVYKNTSTNARLSRFVGGVETSIFSTIALANVGDLELEATVASDGSQVAIVIRENGVQKQTYTDTNAARLTIGRTAIVWTSTAAQSGAYDAITCFCDTPVGGTGVVQAKTIRVGRRTPAQNGSVVAAAPQLDLLVSGTVGYWEFERVSGDSTAWPAYFGGSQTPRVSRDLTDADAGTTAVYDVIIDGVRQASTKRLTVSVQPIAEAVPALSVASQAGIGRLPKASLGGCAVELMEGCGDALTIGSENPVVAQAVLTFSGFNTHTGRFTIQHAPGTSDYLKGGISIIGSANIDLVGLRIHDALDTWDGVSSIHGSSYQLRSLIAIATSSSIYINGGSIGAPASVLADPTRWPTAITYTDGGNPLSQQADMQILGNLAIQYVSNGITGGNLDNFHFNGYTISDFCSNAMFLGGAKLSNGTVEHFVHKQGWVNPANTADHRDILQIGSSTAKASYDTLMFRYGVLDVAGGDNEPQGAFTNDVAYNFSGAGATLTDGEKLTGYTMNNATFQNVVGAIGALNNFVMDLGTNWLIDRCTGYRPPALNDTTEMLFDPQPRADVVTESVGGAQHQSSGTVTRCAFHTLTAVAGTGFTKTSNIEFNTVKGGGFSGASGSLTGGANETARQAYYATFFSDPTSDDPMVHAKPVTAGALKLGDGTYAGALLPDGSWNDGLAHA